MHTPLIKKTMNTCYYSPLFYPRRNSLQRLQALCFSALLAITALAGSVPAAADARVLAGKWALNLEESDKVSISYDEGSGAGRSKVLQNISMTVMGLPLPSRTRTPSQSRMAPKNPTVLVSNLMQIEPAGEQIRVTYDEEKKEVLRKGHYRGRDTSWSKKKIRQRYKTPDRKVTKTWTMRSDGRLLVEVKINPPKDKSRTYRRVFDRVTPTTAE